MNVSEMDFLLFLALLRFVVSVPCECFEGEILFLDKSQRVFHRLARIYPFLFFAIFGFLSCSIHRDF